MLYRHRSVALYIKPRVLDVHKQKYESNNQVKMLYATPAYLQVEWTWIENHCEDGWCVTSDEGRSSKDDKWNHHWKDLFKPLLTNKLKDWCQYHVSGPVWLDKKARCHFFGVKQRRQKKLPTQRPKHLQSGERSRTGRLGWIRFSKSYFLLFSKQIFPLLYMRFETTKKISWIFDNLGVPQAT